jgi:hypothetical protein
MLSNWSDRRRRLLRVSAAWAGVACLLAAGAAATSVIPITDQELYRRADVVVHGVVVSSDATVDEAGRPETLTVIEPISILKGSLSGPLVIHQLGAELPDGRALKMWGRPEYAPGTEVVVFALSRAAGEFATAEMLLGKFRVLRDEAGVRFAVPELSASTNGAGVEIFDSLDDAAGGRPTARPPGGAARFLQPSADSLEGPRNLDRFVAALSRGRVSRDVLERPAGALRPVRHATDSAGRRIPEWGMINNSLWRWNNGATAGWSFNGTANITGGGAAEATGALAAWTTDPNSNINYTAGSGNTIYLNAGISNLGCGWNTCLTGAGVIGCGGPNGGGTHTWQGESYVTIGGGTVELRSYCTLNGYDSITTQAVLTHELGHTMGLGHSDQNVSPHDVCRGDEGAAQMRSTVQHSTLLGTDDQDAIRWLYGDLGNSCTFAVNAITPSYGSVGGGTLVTVVGAGFQAGATVTIGGASAPVSSVAPNSILATTPPGTAGAKDVVVTIAGPQSRTLTAGYTYGSASFYTLTPCRVLDTRNATGPLGGPALTANSDRTFAVATSSCGIPATARAISINLTVTQPTAAGDIRIYSAGGGLPGTSAVNYGAARTRANSQIAPLGTSAGLTVHCDQPSGTMHLIIDVNGYFQ